MIEDEEDDPMLEIPHDHKYVDKVCDPEPPVCYNAICSICGVGYGCFLERSEPNGS